MSHSYHAHDHGHIHPSPNLPAGHARLMRIASYASVTVAAILLTTKLVAWWMTDSLAMLSSFTDSVFDVLMSVVNMLAVRYALKPADDDHRFGHTSIEDLAGLAQCAFIFSAMAMIILQALERLSGNNETLENPALGIGVSLLGIGLTSVLVVYQTYVTRRTNSLVIAADRMHYVGDILFNLGVIIAFVLSSWGGYGGADAAIAIIIALLVLRSTWPLGVRAFNNLMDREMPDADKKIITNLIDTMPDIKGYHNLRTRYSGAKAFVQLHIDVDSTLNFKQVHAITDRLERSIINAFPAADVIVHPDPVSINEPTTSPNT
ncbi:MAG: cation diffusion facilitator family transporter [Rickettsiales bacterium]